jgi:hypothetical protein
VQTTDELWAELLSDGRARWVPGMVSQRERIRIAWVLPGGIAGGIRDDDQRVRPDNTAVPYDDRPDWNDWGTLRAVLGLVQEAYGNPCAFVRPVIDTEDVLWFVWVEGTMLGHGPTEAHALLAALKAAPNEREG